MAKVLLLLLALVLLTSALKLEHEAQDEDDRDPRDGQDEAVGVIEGVVDLDGNAHRSREVEVSVDGNQINRHNPAVAGTHSSS